MGLLKLLEQQELGFSLEYDLAQRGCKLPEQVIKVNGVAVMMPFSQLLQINGVFSWDIIYTLQNYKINLQK